MYLTAQLSTFLYLRQTWYSLLNPAKAYLISPTNSLTFPKTEECGAVNQNFVSFTG